MFDQDRRTADRLVVMMSVKCPLSLRDVEELPAERKTLAGQALRPLPRLRSVETRTHWTDSSATPFLRALYPTEEL